MESLMNVLPPLHPDMDGVNERGTQPNVEVIRLYNRKTAYAVIEQSMRDYAAAFEPSK
jgi:hypothetical protein